MHSADLFVYNLATLNEGQKLVMKRQSKINFPKLPSKKVKEAEGQKQVACWIDVRARQPGVTLYVRSGGAQANIS